MARKALAFGYGIAEVPAVLEWKDHKFSKSGSSEQINLSDPRPGQEPFDLCAFGSTVSLMFGAGILLAMLSLVPLALAVYNLFTPTPSAFLALRDCRCCCCRSVYRVRSARLQNLAVRIDVWRCGVICEGPLSQCRLRRSSRQIDRIGWMAATGGTDSDNGSSARSE